VGEDVIELTIVDSELDGAVADIDATVVDDAAAAVETATDDRVDDIEEVVEEAAADGVLSVDGVGGAADVFWGEVVDDSGVDEAITGHRAWTPLFWKNNPIKVFGDVEIPEHAEFINLVSVSSPFAQACEQGSLCTKSSAVQPGMGVL
jgi:hypothetical protein